MCPVIGAAAATMEVDRHDSRHSLEGTPVACRESQGGGGMSSSRVGVMWKREPQRSSRSPGPRGFLGTGPPDGVGRGFGCHRSRCSGSRIRRTGRGSGRSRPAVAGDTPRSCRGPRCKGTTWSARDIGPTGRAGPRGSASSPRGSHTSNLGPGAGLDPTRPRSLARSGRLEAEWLRRRPLDNKKGRRES